MTQLTTGEIAKLFAISKYRIRHYIDKGILTPQRNAENDYYIFAEKDIYRLYQIITLREIGFSLKEIQTSLKLANIEAMFAKAQTKIQHEIKQLLATQKIINKLVNAQKKSQLNEVVFVEQEERYFKKLRKDLIAADSIAYLKTIGQAIFPIDEPYFVLTKDLTEVMCLKTAKRDHDYVFPAGTYACINFAVKNKTDLEKQVHRFEQDLTSKVRDASTKNFLLFENIYCSLAYNDQMVYSIEAKL